MKFSEKIRARRAPLAVDEGPEPSALHTGSDNGCHDTIPAPPILSEHCSECSRPERPTLATHGDRCVYCQRRLTLSDSNAFVETYMGAVAALARGRLLELDKPSAALATATTRELAKPHPSTWPSQDGDP